ncbi:hypothetical protein V1525DRAFT_391974 [Lipomyces kononenkoae]|uniref:Uncharacterized protein n=1 Tax=Lipomyces kononenkoae TaxID=34357 RepID=A0ACC3SRD1_LIPKO
MTVDNKMLRMGVAGCGRMGQIHINNMLDMRFITVTAVCSVIKAELDWALNTIDGVVTFEDFDDFIDSDRFDAVLIVTPGNLHHDQVIAAMHHGKHVFCEKPLSTDAKSAWNIYYESLQFPDLKVCCGLPRRYVTPYVEAARKIRNGDIGKVTTVRSQTTDLRLEGDHFVNYVKNCGGIFVDSCVHDIDACLYLIGEDKTPATAFSTGTTNVWPLFRQFGDVDDGMGLVTFESGDVIMSVYGCRNNPHGHHTMTEIIGTKGRILVNGQPRLFALDISDEKGTYMEAPDTQMTAFGYAFKLEIEAFRDWLLYNTEPNFNLKDAAKAVSIGSALMDSLRKKDLTKVNLY